MPLFLRLAARVDLLAQRLERPGREDGLNGQGEILGDLEGQLEAGAVFASLEEADGLVVHPNRFGQLVAADSALGAKDGDTVKIRDVEFDYEDEDKWDEEDEAATQGRARRQ